MASPFLIDQSSTSPLSTPTFTQHITIDLLTIYRIIQYSMERAC